MRLSKIEIKGLFNLFDYTIPLENEENLLILTGPNGFGKTMILNIIDSLFNNNLDFFQKLVFDTIRIWINNDINILIESKIIVDSINISIFREQTQVLSYIHSVPNEDKILTATDRIFNRIKERKTGVKLEFSDSNFYEELKQITDTLNVYLIKEQRLLSIKTIRVINPDLFQEENSTTFINTIEAYAKELKDLINSYLDKSFTLTQQIDSSFPKRLLNEKGHLSIEEFDIRFKALKQKQEKLKQFGLSQSEQEIPSYDEKNANVLLVYLKDSEEKISVFDGLLNKLELFTNILNERRFTFKSIKIDRKKGFIFLTSKGDELSLTDLSSGEQHEVVLLYELIFKSNKNTLVLIDEPEISLHVTWQKEFLSDLLKIMELQQMQVIVATHSPQIINDRWDLVFNLETQTIQ